MVESRFCSWVWSSAGVAHHGAADPLDDLPVSTLARLAGLVMAGLRVVFYGQVAAAAAVWLVRGCLGRLMVGLVRVGSVALLPVVVSPNVVCAAGTFVSVLVSCVLVGPSVVWCSLLKLVGRVPNGTVAVFCCVCGYGRWRAWRTTVPAIPLDAVPVSTRARLAALVLAGLRVVCLRSGGGCSCGVVRARLSWTPHGQLGLRGFRRAAAGGRIAKSCLCSRHICVGAG